MRSWSWPSRNVGHFMRCNLGISKQCCQAFSTSQAAFKHQIETQDLKHPTEGDAHTHPTSSEEENPLSARHFHDLGRTIKNDFAHFQANYDKPKYPIVLAHGLMGFDELRLAGRFLPGVQYWRGITGAMEKQGIEVITTSVPTTGSIQERAEVLHEQIKAKLPQLEEDGEKNVNIIAHSMGGLDSRFLISTIRPKEYNIRSLTTIATPHRGSSAADMVIRDIGPENLEGLYKLLARLKVDSGAFSQLTRRYVTATFNPNNLDSESVQYFSYGASAQPSIFSVFRISHDLMMELEGPNDGLVSVASSKWGVDGYKGTLMGVTHLDLINWTNRIKRLAATLTLVKPDFNAVAFYLAIAHMLAKEGL